MIHIIDVEDLNRPELDAYRTLKGKPFKVDEGFFVAEGIRVVTSLLRSDFAVISVLITQDWLGKINPLLQARKEESLPIYVATKEIAEEIVGFSIHQGIMAMGRVAKLYSLEDSLPSWKSPHLTVALDGIADSENMGVILRNSAAFGVDALLIGETCCSPFLRRSVRVSLGAIFSLQTVPVPHLPSALSRLSHHGENRIVAACPEGTNHALWETDLTGNTCLVFGGEAAGISPPVLSACHQKTMIPMAAGADSLNVACATSVFLYEAIRQRGRGG